MTLFQSIILGMVQGITEFLPISSSAHLILVPWFFKWNDPGLAFDVFIHLGTLLAVMGYFARDWWILIKAGVVSLLERKIGFEKDRLLFWMLFCGSIPTGISGILLHEYAQTLFRSPLLVAVSLASIGFLLYWVDGKYPGLRNFEELRFNDALIIGIAQAFSIIPGVSRSGSTMLMGRFLGLNREAAARFSFLLSFPIILAAAAYEWKNFTPEAMNVSLSFLVSGLVSSTVFGMLSIHVLLQYLRSASFALFAWYRIVLAWGIVVWSLMTHP